MGDPRDDLLAALACDLLGPTAEDERLRLPPSRFYLTGFLVPREARDAEEADPTSDDELAAGDDETEEETAGAEPEPKQKNRLPASMGLSVLLPPGPATDTLTATLRWADYVLEDEDDHADHDPPGNTLAPDGRARRPRRTWRRVPRGPIAVAVPLDRAALAAGIRVAETPGVVLKGKLADVPTIPARALSLFVVNERPQGEKGRIDEQYLFQVKLEVTFAPGLRARPNQRDAESTDWDDRVADLQFRDRREYAVGHGVSVEVPAQPSPITTVRTTWLPRAEVRRVVTHDDVPAMVAMEDLAALADAAAVRAALDPLPAAYQAWIDEQRRLPLDGGRADTRSTLLDRAEQARRRIAEGIHLLAADPEVLEAFRLANRAMALAARRRSPQDYVTRRPEWRLFQLAFLLLDLPSIANDAHDDRATVELIFFPTGGGKTEAYLGVIAFALVLRRLRGRERPDRGLGVAVLLRYTLRLLTLDQLGRAATLICALETLRRADPARLGDVRFAVGLWVGRTATANTLGELAERLTEYKSSAARKPASPFPLTNCPWCRMELGPDSFALRPTPRQPTEVVVGCLNPACDFSAATHREGLPVLFVDEQIYRELPAFLVATVDKLAMLPWRGETGMLFGRVQARRGREFFGPLDGKQTGAEALPDGLRPPELIVQDELHLISGPLGTMVGLYETAVEALCTRDGRRPKILASTATVRRAGDQIQALMGRNETALFPPPGVDDSETFFARVQHDRPGRLYVGVAAPGRAMKAILLRTYVALLAGAQRLLAEAGPETADSYMTLAGYFNSLRELGGMRRLVEDEVRTRCAQVAERQPPNPWLRARDLQKEPVELTSREHTSTIAETKTRLGRPHAHAEHVDVLLASNMISVGVDIDRLGLMVVAGQPKTTAEYIQCTSRVGRRWPGLVVTCFNVHKPRDRSHYEQFTAYHDCFYRFVEVTSLTPFSGPALDRGLAGTLVAIARLLRTALTAPGAAMDIERHRDIAEAAVRALAARAGAQPGVSGARYDRTVAEIAQRGRNLVDAWISLVAQARHEAGRRAYSPYDRDRAAGKRLLHTPLDEDLPPEGTDDAKFVAPTSMRDVEPTVHLWLERRRLGGKR
jgi:hypothetical protein